MWSSDLPIARSFGRLWATCPILFSGFAATDFLADDDDAARFLYHDPTVTPEREALWAATPAMNMDFARAIVGTERSGLADDLAALALPTLVMINLCDRHVGVDVARDLADRLPHGLLRLFERSAHLIDEEEPSRHVAVITDFLRAAVPRTAASVP